MDHTGCHQLHRVLTANSRGDRCQSYPAVIVAAIPYLQARLCAVPAVGINFAFRGFWNAVQQPQIYMNTLLVMHAVNISLSLLLIFGGGAVQLFNSELL
jgi:Na+-driven multidrug efflux pump